MGDVVGLTISINKINESGFTDVYMEPLVLNEPLSIRILCIFPTFNSICPSSIQLDMFSSKLKITFTESHMLMITELFNYLKKYKSDNQTDTNDGDKRCNTIRQNSSKFKNRIQ